MKAIFNFSGKGFRVLVTAAVALFFSLQVMTAQEWYNPAWPFRASLTIENSLTSALTDYQVQVSLGAAGPWSISATDGSDLRFTTDDGVTEIPYWIEEWSYGTSALIWLKVPAIAASGNTTIYMYYGSINMAIPPVIVSTPPSGPFTRATGNPIIPSGDATGESFLAENIVYDPVSQHYWMVFTNIRGGFQHIGLMWSDNPSNPGAWTLHSSQVISNGNAPHLMEYNGTWYIFYSDRASGVPYNIVVQSSSTVNGTFANKQTILTPTETWENNRVDEPYVLRRNDGKWVLVYMGAGADNKFQIGYATSDLLLEGYQRYDNGDTNNEGLFIPYGAMGSFDYGMASHPWVYEYEGTYYIGYTASATGNIPYQTALATTSDWSSYVKHGIMFPAGADGNTFRGAVTRIGDNYVLSYVRGTGTPTVYTSGIAIQPVFSEFTAAEVGAEQVFDFYDDFSGTSLNVTKWGIAFSQQVGTISLDGSGVLKITQPPVAGSYTKLYAKYSFGLGYLVETRTMHDNPGTGRSLSVGFGIAGLSSQDGLLRIGSGLGTAYWMKQAATSGSAYTINNMGQLSDANNHVFRIYREPAGTVASYQIDYNTIEQIATATHVPTIALNPFLMSYGTDNIITSDWVRVRKWAGAELIASAGSSEFNGCLWEGDESTDWHTVGNWNGGIPDATKNVLITGDPLYLPVISLETAFCDNILIDTGTSLELSGLSQLEVKGGWINNGTFIGGSGTVLFNGAAQTVTGNVQTTFYDLIISSSDTVDLGVNIMITGDLNLTSGVFDLGIYTSDHQLNDPLEGTLTISDNTTLIIGGTGTMPASFSSYVISPFSKVVYSGAHQTVMVATYGNLVLSGSEVTAVKTFPASITIAGNTTIKGTAKASLTTGTNSTTATLLLGTVPVSAGTWGSTISAAGFRNNDWFDVGAAGILTVAASVPSGTWLGVNSTNWNATTNWAGGAVPVAGTDVVIPSFANFIPVISGLATPAVCNNMTVNQGGSLGIDPGQALTVNGFLVNNGSILIESSWVNSNGSLIVLGEPSGSGTVSYKRFLREGDDTGDKHLLASPVGGEDVSDLFTAFSSKIDFVRTWDEYNGAWESIVSGPLASGQGFNIYQTDDSDGEFTFTGSLVNSASIVASSPFEEPYLDRGADPYGNIDPTQIIWTPGRGYISGVWTNWGGGGWNLLGNPFTSAMNAATFISTNAGDFSPYYEALYVYDGKNGYYRYVASTVPGYEPDYVQGGSFGSFIQAGQGFMVLANNDGVTFDFSTSMQVHNTVLPLLKSAATEDPWPGLKLKVKWGEKENMTTIVFNSEMKNSLDPGYDVGLFSAGPEVEIYTAMVEKDESINLTRQALPVAGADTVKIPVGIDCYAGAEITFSAITVPLGDKRFWLEDRANGIFTDITTKSYTVTLPEKTFGTGRFYIIASSNTPTGIKIPAAENDNLRIWVSRDKLIIKGEVGQKASCELYDIQGRRILESRLVDGDLNTIDIPSGLHGLFMVRVIDGTLITTRKIAIL